MKMAKKILLYLLLFILLLFTGLFFWRPYLIRVLWYRSPNAVTYKAFPTEVVQKSDTAFYFFRAKKMRDDLDTLHVLNGDQQSVMFKDYFTNGKLNAFIVIRNDSILYEKYSPGYSDSTITTVFSGAKSMISIMIGQALEQKKIGSLDDHVTRYIPELKSNSAFRAITIRNLLDMKSGLAFQDALGGIVSAFFSDEAKYYYTHDMKAELLKATLAHKPGTFWQYKSIDPILLGWVLENATGKSISQFFEQYTWRKIGAEYPASFGLDQPNGLANTASRFQVTAIDWAKIGRLFLNKGRYGRSQVLPQTWINQSSSIGSAEPVSAKGWQKSAQHFLWWIPQEGKNGDFAAEGMRGQRLYIDPLTNTIIVQFADRGAGDYPYRKISRYLAGLPFRYPN